MSKKLSCCYILKNEEKFIVTSLNKLFWFADEIVIVDTGSTDNTHKIVESWISKNKLEKYVKFLKVGNKFHDQDGDFDFSAARNFGFENATCDYVMWLDAADVIENQKSLKKIFKEVTSKHKNVYFTIRTRVSENVSYPRTRICPRKHAKMVGMVHEYMQVLPTWKKCNITNHEIVNRRNADSLDRNLRILLKSWEIKNNVRTAFYLGNTYYGLNELEKSIEWFKKAVELKDEYKKFNEQVFKSMELICDISLTLSHRNKKDYLPYALEYSNKMIEYCKPRCEGWYYKGKYFMEMGNYEKALRNLNIITMCKIPKNPQLWLNPKIYKGNVYTFDIEMCEVAIKNKGMLEPETIMDLKDFNPDSINNFTSQTIGKTLYL